MYPDVLICVLEPAQLHVLHFDKAHTSAAFINLRFPTATPKSFLSDK